MQSLGRVIPRLSVNSPTLPAASQAFRIVNQPSRRPSICLQCKIRTQTRRFADTPKPPESSTTRMPPPPSSSQTAGKSLEHSKSDTETPSEQLKTLDADLDRETSPNPGSSISDHVHSDLPSAAESRRSAINKRLSHLMDHLQGNIFIASQRINDLTGYSGIEALKTRITALETKLAEAQEAVRSSRLVYKTTVADRASTQREVTTLLARKDTWTPQDLERFTALYRMDHSNEQAVQEAATRLADAEREAETAASKLSSSILSRYHEEQIWSDKIRRMSTWGTWGLMGVNVLLFLVFQFGFEPWRRRRLVKGFEDKVKEALEKEKIELLTSKQTIESLEEISPKDQVASAVPTEPQNEKDGNIESPEAVLDAIATRTRLGEETGTWGATEMRFPKTWGEMKNHDNWAAAAQNWKSDVKDLFSERVVQLRKQDVTIIALESAATGATIVAIIATLLLRHT